MHASPFVRSFPSPSPSAPAHAPRSTRQCVARIHAIDCELSFRHKNIVPRVYTVGAVTSLITVKVTFRCDGCIPSTAFDTRPRIAGAQLDRRPTNDGCPCCMEKSTTNVIECHQAVTAAAAAVVSQLITFTVDLSNTIRFIRVITNESLKFTCTHETLAP
jgi:hypothetical protein